MPKSDPILIVDYGMGNLGSIANMIKKSGGIGVITGDPDALSKATKLILPGVGAFDQGMAELKSRGIIPVLDQRARVGGVPVLGICLGMQLLTRRSEEGVLPGLGWIDAETRRFDFAGRPEPLRIPHMGWNEVAVHKPSPLFGEPTGPWRFYFVHSYYVSCANERNVLCTTNYGHPFASGVMNGNIFGVQFHPEKSHSFGLRLLRRFLEL